MYSNLVRLLLFNWFTFIQELQPSVHDSRTTVLLICWSDIGLLVVVDVVVVISSNIVVDVVIIAGVEQG